jgi:hypothetical protein
MTMERHQLGLENWKLRCLLRECDDLLSRMDVGKDLQRRIKREIDPRVTLHGGTVAYKDGTTVELTAEEAGAYLVPGWQERITMNIKAVDND